MKKVFKYPFSVQDIIELDLPVAAEILHCDMQPGSGFAAWCLVDPTAPTAKRRIKMAGTGHPIGEHVKRFINTIMMENGRLVFHFFEIA